MQTIHGTILLVDDSKSVRFMLTEMLRAAGYKVITSEDGRGGWDTVRNNSIDLIISDLQMPVMDGLELCNLVKQHKKFRNIYFIMLSAWGEIATKVEGFTVGADDYIVKTTPEAELLARIQAGMRIRMLEKELRETQAFLYQQEKMASVGQLAAGVAHEINNPMGFISSNLTSLARFTDRLIAFINSQAAVLKEIKDSVVLEELRKKRKKLKIDYIMDDSPSLIRESLDGADRVKKIVRDLKGFSRVDEAEFKHADINECLESTMNIAWNELKYKATVHRDYGDLPLTMCYPQQLNQVFMNILINAAQAIEKQGEVSIKTWNDAGSLFVKIADTGRGIPPEVINRIYEPFFTTKEVGKGTGIGLSISHDIIRKHDGEITVESEEGKGTTFIVRIPVVEG